MTAIFTRKRFDMEIIEIDENNICEAGKIHSESWKESHRSFCSEEFVASHTKEAQTDYIRAEMSKGKNFYMLIDKYPVGIVSVYENTIENLYVLPSEQRKGYGSRLLHYAMEQCDKVPILWVLNTNVEACRLYMRNGFYMTEKKERTEERNV